MLKRTSWLLEESQDRLKGGKKTRLDKLNIWTKEDQNMFDPVQIHESCECQGALLLQMFLYGLQERIGA